MNLKNLLKFKINNRYIINFLNRYPEWCLLMLAFLLVTYTLIIFGLYAIKNPEAPTANENLQIKKELYRQVLTRLLDRDAKTQRGIEKNYPDIFR